VAALVLASGLADVEVMRLGRAAGLAKKWKSGDCGSGTNR
jgi:hypothetical protein